MTKTTATTAGGVVAAAAVAATITVSSITGTTDVTGTYQVDNISEYKSEIAIEVPDEFTPDIIVLKVNDVEVDKTLLPDGKFVTYPSVVSNASILSMDMYVRGDKAAEAEFNEDGTLSIKAEKKYVKEEEDDAQN